MGAAYHTNVEALGGQPACRAEVRLAQALRFSLDGHLPYVAQASACAKFVSEKVGLTNFERRLTGALSMDINPLMIMAGQIKSPSHFFAAFNAYNQHSILAAKTYVKAWTKEGVQIERDVSNLPGVDLAPARDSTQLTAELLLAAVKQHQSQGHQTLLVDSVAELTCRAGLSGTLTHDAAQYFGAEPGARVQDLSKVLGCSSRTLVRWFSSMPFAAVQLKQVCMLTHATKAMSVAGADTSLTGIAADAGFSDLAHFSRVFKKAVGVSPSVMRQALLWP